MRGNPQRFLNTPAPLPPNLSFVLNLSPSAMTLGLGNVRALLEALDHPEKNFRCVVVAGTNGKGSVTAFLSSILSSNGIRTGWYSSPHVYSVNERICVDNVPVDIDRMEAAASRIVQLHDEIGYSYFEALTAIAFLVFKESEVEVAVLETGLGGRFDATNVVEPELTVLTSVSVDHRRILGDTREEILREKLGITRPGVPLLVGPLSSGLAAVVREKADRDGFPVTMIDDLGTVEPVEASFEGTRANVRTKRVDYGALPLPFIGSHQRANALLSISAAEYILDDVTNLVQASSDTRMPGRFDVVKTGEKRVVLDVAHNDAALIAAGEALIGVSPRGRNAMVLGMLQRKDVIDFPVRLHEFASRVYLVEPVIGESYTAPALLESIGIENIHDRRLEVILCGPQETDENVDDFVDGLIDRRQPFDVVLVTGSHRTVEKYGHSLGRKGFL